MPTIWSFSKFVVSSAIAFAVYNKVDKALGWVAKQNATKIAK